MCGVGRRRAGSLAIVVSIVICAVRAVAQPRLGSPLRPSLHRPSGQSRILLHELWLQIYNFVHKFPTSGASLNSAVFQAKNGSGAREEILSPVGLNDEPTKARV